MEYLETLFLSLGGATVRGPTASTVRQPLSREQSMKKMEQSSIRNMSLQTSPNILDVCACVLINYTHTCKCIVLYANTNTLAVHM